MHKLPVSQSIQILETIQLQSDKKSELEKSLIKNIVDIDGLSLSAAEEIICDGSYTLQKLEATGMLEENIDYKISANLLVWQNSNYFAICDISENNFQVYNFNKNANREIILEQNSIWADIKEGECVPKQNTNSIEIVFSGTLNAKAKGNSDSVAIYRITVKVPHSSLISKIKIL